MILRRIFSTKLVPTSSMNFNSISSNIFKYEQFLSFLFSLTEQCAFSNFYYRSSSFSPYFFLFFFPLYFCSSPLFPPRTRTFSLFCWYSEGRCRHLLHTPFTYFLLIHSVLLFYSFFSKVIEYKDISR